MIGKFHFVLFILILMVTGCRHDQERSEKGHQNRSLSPQFKNQSLTYRWAEIALKATAKDTERFKPRPTVTSRYLGLTFVALFDAWTRFDEKAIPVYLKEVERFKEKGRTERNKETAISYAACRVLSEYYYSDSTMFRDFMISLGYDPDNYSLDPNTPEGIGNLSAKAVIESRKHDGSNQYGNEAGINGNAYFDYTGYQPVNSADQNVDINRWQPKYFSDGKGGKFAPGCLTPHWGKVKPIALKSADQFRSPPPPLVGSKQLEKEVKEVVDLQAGLTNEQKALVEFMRDGPASVQQAGHWLMFAMDVSVRDKHNLDQDVKMYFLNQVTAMDAFIACWDTKMYYDFARPYALVHYYFKDKKIRGWAGPQSGMKEMKGQEWRPYSPDDFLCPPFPAYVSGHSTVSGGCSEVLKLFTGNDYFGVEVKRVPGQLTESDHVGDTVILKMPTFTETADMAGFSRVLGGYHIQADNIEGLGLGRKVGQEVFKWYQHHVGVKSEE